MKYILILLALTLSLNTFAAKKVCHDDKNRYAKPEQLCDDKNKCSSGMTCKEIDEKSTILSAVPGTGEKAETKCEDVVQTQAQKDAAAAAEKAKKDAAKNK